MEIIVEGSTVYNGDCLEVMDKLDKCSVDSIVTDPPYHLTSIVKRFGKEDSAPAQFGTDGAFARTSKGFMGKEWDGGDIAFQVDTWRKCYELLKPGDVTFISAFPFPFEQIVLCCPQPFLLFR